MMPKRAPVYVNTAITKVLISDDHPLFCKGLKLMLTYELGMHVTDVNYSSEVFYFVENQELDLLILNLGFPGMDGLEVLKQVKKLRPQLPVIVASAFPEDEYAERVFKAGAVEFIDKTLSNEAFKNVILKVLRTRDIDCNGKGIEADSTDSTQVMPHKKLSDREYQIFHLLALGRTVGDIARSLCLSVQTISTHRRRILRKMELASNMEIIRYALKYQLIRIT